MEKEKPKKISIRPLSWAILLATKGLTIKEVVK